MIALKDNFSKLLNKKPKKSKNKSSMKESNAKVVKNTEKVKKKPTKKY
jgi:hypothetical protein